MLTWLKEILEGAEINDGKLDVAAVMNAVKTEFPKYAVPKADFNEKTAKLKAAEDTITQMKKDAGDNAGLLQKIKDYETQVQKLQKDAADTAKTYALRTKLSEAGALDPDYLIYKQGGVDKFTFDKSGAPVGVDDIIKPLKESSPHLFKQKEGANYNPAGGSGGAGKAPKDMSYEELCAYLESNPTAALE